MTTRDVSTPQRRWTVDELRRLPAEQCDAILAAAAERAAAEYENNPELTAFEAFGENDLYGHSSNSVTE